MTLRMLLWRCCLLLIIYCALPLTVSQSAEILSVKGMVTNEVGQPLSEIMVTAVNTETQYGAVAYTDVNGHFILPDLSIGAYRIFAEKQGYRLHEENVTLKSSHAELPKTNDLLISLEKVFGIEANVSIPRPKNYATISVLYGTDRKRSVKGNGTVEYGAHRGTLDLGHCEVSIPRDHRLGNLESPSIWRLEFKNDPSKHVVVLSVAPLEQEAFTALLRQRIIQSGHRSAIIFIHGYNVGFEAAVRQAGQITYDLGFTGVPMVYSWPSKDSVLDYVADGDQAQRASTYLNEFLHLVLAQEDLDEVHVIAHSMGNRVLTGAFQQLSVSGSITNVNRISQIVLVAPDIDTDIFKTQLAPRVAEMGRQRTLYASKHDVALLLSKRLNGGYPRAGDLSETITIVGGIDTIDASEMDTSLVGHSYYADNRSVIGDLFQVVRNAKPFNRFGLLPMEIKGQSYWKFVP